MYALAADLVLALHVAIVLFVVGGLVAIIAGNLAGWRWVNSIWLRGAHLAAIAVVAAEAWAGIVCPLTTLEASLRARAGLEGYAGGFVEHWLQRLIFFEAPAWMFTTAYTLFGFVVLAVWWAFPPRRTDSTPTAKP
jgi:hypothetical protein